MLYLYQLGGGCTCEGLQKAIGLYLRPMGQDAFYSLQITQCLINTVLKNKQTKKNTVLSTLYMLNKYLLHE